MGERHSAGDQRRVGRLPLELRATRQERALQSQETYSVGELCEEVRALLGAGLPGVWVAGEVQRVRVSQRGHLYFELVEKGAGDQVVGKLEGVIWSRDHQVVRRELRESGQEIADGHEIRCQGRLDFYPPFGRIQLVVRRVDPLFALGMLEKRRRETLEALAKAGLLETNKAKRLPLVPLDVALVTSEGSAAYHDFLSTLRESGYGFRVSFLHAAVQGRDAEREVARALQTASRLDVDCAVVVRGGGSRTDLAAFDSRRVAGAVARCAVPVITGLGHEIDEGIADKVAHTATKTPTRAAEFLVQTVGEADRAVETLANALRETVREPVREAARRLSAAERGLAVARYRIEADRRRLEGFAGMLGRAAGRRLSVERGRLDGIARDLRVLPGRRLRTERALPGELGGRIAGAARSRLRETKTLLTGWRRLVDGLRPERTLARGFSITRDGQGGLVRSAKALSEGERLSTELTDGVVLSRVEGAT